MTFRVSSALEVLLSEWTWELRFRFVGAIFAPLVMGVLCLVPLFLACMLLVGGYVLWGIVAGMVLFGMICVAIAATRDSWQKYRAWQALEPPPGMELTAYGWRRNVPMYQDSTGFVVMLGNGRR